jgi:hypothetical protein
MSWPILAAGAVLWVFGSVVLECRVRTIARAEAIRKALEVLDG